VHFTRPAAQTGRNAPDQDGLSAPQLAEQGDHIPRSQEAAQDLAHPFGLPG
jgi:hypothetical protein